MVRRLLAWVAVGVLLGGVAGCGGDDSEDAAAVTVTEDLVYAISKVRTLTLDMHAPTKSGEWPIMIHFPGTGGATPFWLPQDIAGQGAIVFVVDYPSPTAESAVQEQGAGFRAAAESAACVIHFARARASDLGSDNPVVVLTGFSIGGGVAAHAALFGAGLEARWEEYAAVRGGPPRQVDCEVTEGSTHVDALVGIAGPYDLFVGFEGRYGREWMQERDPELWQLLNGSIGENPDLKVRLLHGEADGTIPYQNSVEFEATLTDAGYDVRLIPFASGHTEPPELTVQTVMEVLAD